jgi:integrase
MDSKTEPRPAFFSPETRDLFIQLKRTKTFWDGKVFPGVPGIQGVIAEMLSDLGLQRPGRGPHTFRHYLATKLFYEGEMRIEDISVLLGTTVEIIVKNYLHPTPDMLKRRVFKAMQWHDPWDEI